MWKTPGRSTEADISCDLFEMDAHLQKCNHANGDRWSLEPLYAVRLDRYSTTAVPQLGVGQATRNVGPGPYVGESS